MKIPYKLIILGLFLITACNQKKTTQNNVETTFTVNPKLIKSISDTLYIKTSGRGENFLRFYDDKEGYCKLRNDTIMIFNCKGLWTGKAMSIFITKGVFTFNIYESSCTYTHFYKTIEQQLTLNKENFKVNDTIVGEMFFKSIFVLDSIKPIVDTTIVKGKFKFRVRDADYDDNSLTQEQNYQEFLELSKNRPDTITSLGLWNCGLNKLPDEIILFKNLTELFLNGNDLSNADLSLLSSLKKMKNISFQNCNLNKFPTVILSYKQLTKLDLWNNGIKELPAQLFQMTLLKELEIGANDYSELPSAIGNLRNLEMLGVCSTSVKTFPKTILQLTNLKRIYPPDKMDYFPPELARCLSETFSYSGIKNFNDFKNKIPKDE